MSFCNTPAILDSLNSTGKMKLQDGINRDFLSCGKYYFDGHYNVVTFEAGMTFYHGSARLANSLYAYPVGVNYFNNPPNLNLMVVASDPREIEEIISENSNLSPSWYGDINTAKLYSGSIDIKNNPSLAPLKDNCTGKCIFAYKLVKNATFLLLNNDYNVVKLNNNTTPKDKDELKKMFGDNDFNSKTIDQNKRDPVKIDTIDSTPLNIVRVNSPLKRTSYYGSDLGWTTSMCSLSGIFKRYGYAGYVAPSTLTPPLSTWKGGYFHPEIVFCNPINYLKRDLENPYDWQYNSYSYPPNSLLKSYIEYIKKFKTININFHSGNLYEHSVWALLWTEYVCKENELKISLSLQNDVKVKILAFTSFIHDVGKCIKNPNDQDPIMKPNGDYVYFDVKNHPFNGYMQLSTGFLPNNINLTQLLRELGIPDTVPILGINTILFIAHLILAHRDFGELVLKNMSTQTPDQYIREILLLNFVRELKRKSRLALSPYPDDNDNNITEFIKSVIVIGLADTLSSMPYGYNIYGININRLEQKVNDINKVSTTIPSISNVPAIYSGNRNKQVFQPEILIIKTQKVAQIFNDNIFSYINVWKNS